MNKNKAKLTCKQRKAFYKEETETAKLYKKLGFKAQGKQEEKHAEFFRKQPCR